MTRVRRLPTGWYPSSSQAVRASCDEYLAGVALSDKDFRAVVVPHAGWAYSGELACRTIARMSVPIDTVAVIGGHLRKSDPVLVAAEDAVETPLGDLLVNLELTDLIRERIRTEQDTEPDNTVEIQLPLIAHLLGMPRIVHLRCPPSGLALELGQLIAEYARTTPGLAVVGSSDLTHYGPAYGFADHGRGPGAVAWVKDENDKLFVDALRTGDPESIISVANSGRSACSAGGAAAAAAFAQAAGCVESELVGYYTSYDVSPNDSFVGYAGLGYHHSRPDG